MSFVSGRLSIDDGLMHEHIGDLEQECTTLEEAKAVSEQWHTERYADKAARMSSLRSTRKKSEHVANLCPRLASLA